jgi:phage replication O-like protein O
MDELHSEENYVKVPHWVMSYLMTAKLNMTQFRIINAIIRFTYGYHQEEHWMSLDFLSQLTECDKRQIRRELNALIKAGIVLARIENKRRYLKLNPRLAEKMEDSLDLLIEDSLDPYLGDSSDLHIKKKNKEKDIKEKHYIDFNQIDDTFINFYLEYYKKAMKKEHVKISEESYMFIETQINHLIDCGTEQKEWEQQVKQFFKDPIHTPNNRSIVYFLNITYRYFDVGRYDQFDK